MEIHVEHLGGVQFEIKARQHVVVSDQPAENGGFDEGMTPPELLVASLGAWGFYAAQYLKKHTLVAEGTIVRVSADKAKDPARLDNFRIAIDVPCELSQQNLQGIEQSVHHCLIHDYFAETTQNLN